MIDNQRYWWPLATTNELRNHKPLSRNLHGVPVVLFRDHDGAPHILHDRCAHRHAQLSCGRVRGGEIECPYHGWRFAKNGYCTKIPGLKSLSNQKQLIQSYASCEKHGLVWASEAPDKTTPEPVAPAVLENVDHFFMTDTVRCTLAEAAENFLDGFHTHFIHAGWIRRDSKRQSVKAKVRRLTNGIEARYSEEGLQSGLISRLLESDRLESMGRFHLPGIAEIEYRGHRGLNMLITAWLTPETPGRLRIHARVATRRGFVPARLKHAFLKRLFSIILRQDKTILEQTRANIGRFRQLEKNAPMFDSPLDLLGPSIRHLLAGETLDATVERVLICQL